MYDADNFSYISSKNLNALQEITRTIFNVDFVKKVTKLQESGPISDSLESEFKGK